MAAVHHYRRPPCTIDNGTDAPPSAEDMHHEAGTNAPQPEERLHHRSGVRNQSVVMNPLPNIDFPLTAPIPHQRAMKGYVDT